MRSRREFYRHRRAVARRRAVAVLGVMISVVGAWVLFSGDPFVVYRSPAPVTTTGKPPLSPGRARLEVAAALEHGVRKAAALGGSVEAEAMLGSWSEPVLATSPRGGSSRWMRMWSMSKIVTMVALLRALGWGDRTGHALSPEVEDALWGAITRSENCRQRRVILELQQATGGTPATARRAIARVMRAAGARVRPGTEVAPPDAGCIEYLEGQNEIADPLAPALLLGTSTWRIGDAVRFVRAVRAGVYGDAVENFVLAAMRAPKAASREVAPGELTAPLEWGAGRAFAGLAPSYKAGWGGSQDGDFLAGQMVSVDLPGGGTLAAAVMFHPDTQPPTDDPGSTAAPHAVELVMESLRRALR